MLLFVDNFMKNVIIRYQGMNNYNWTIVHTGSLQNLIIYPYKPDKSYEIMFGDSQFKLNATSAINCQKWYLA
jgi:hypothetical protein